MSVLHQKALNKLTADTKRFLKDHGLPLSVIGVLKLAVIVEFWAVLHFRLCEHCMEIPRILRIPLKLGLALTKPFVEGMTSSRLRHGAVIGGGLLLHHSMGVAIAVGAEIGDNCTIFSGVTIAYKGNGLQGGAPRIGNNVRLMAGCKILGNIIIGNDVVIGANAVVLKDVPSGSIAVGIPARVLGHFETTE